MACDVVALFIALIARCTFSLSSSPTFLACTRLYESYRSRWSPCALLEIDFLAAWKNMNEWWSWWNALPARLAAHGPDLEDYLLAYNAQDSTELAADLDARCSYIATLTSCKLVQEDLVPYPDPAQLNSVAAFGTTTPTPAPTMRQLAQKAAVAYQVLRAKLETLVSSAEKGQLARRGGLSLYKGIKSAACMVAGLRTALTVAHCAFLLQLSPPNPSDSSATLPVLPPIVLTRLNSLLERANARIGSMEWASVIETWTEICRLVDKYITVP